MITNRLQECEIFYSFKKIALSFRAPAFPPGLFGDFYYDLDFDSKHCGKLEGNLEKYRLGIEQEKQNDRELDDQFEES